MESTCFGHAIDAVRVRLQLLGSEKRLVPLAGDVLPLVLTQISTEPKTDAF